MISGIWAKELQKCHLTLLVMYQMKLFVMGASSSEEMKCICRSSQREEVRPLSELPVRAHSNLYSIFQCKHR